jgi:hypothetical protein
MLWILLDSNLFETLSRHEGLRIWGNMTYTIITFHLLGLAAGYYVKLKEYMHHMVIAVLFVGSYTLSYMEASVLLAVVYPFTISYYNVIVFTSLTKVASLKELSYIMVFVGWFASGAGLGLALSKVLH